MSRDPTELTFSPKGADPAHRRHVLLISGGFFLFVQLAFLEGVAARLAFTLVFAGFVLAGLWISRKVSESWPQEIVMNREGIRYGDLRPRHGVDSVPWQEVDRIDLFYNQHNMAPFLRIGLRSGAFRSGLRRSRLQRLGLGWDVNIPVAVDAEPDTVLKAALKLWAEAAR